MDNYLADDLNEAEKKAREAEQEILRERDIEDIKHVMGSEQGRRVVWEVLSRGNVFGSCFTSDPHVTAFNEGQRNIALALFQRVMTNCPDQYLKMAAEAKEESRD